MRSVDDIVVISFFALIGLALAVLIGALVV